MGTYYRYFTVCLEHKIFVSWDHRDNTAKLAATMDKLFVLFGVEILKIVPGRVSTEVDARWFTAMLTSELCPLTFVFSSTDFLLTKKEA